MPTELNITPTCNIASVIGFCEGRTTKESIISNARYAIRDGDGGEGGAVIESSISNACDAIGDAVVSNDFGDSDGGDRRVGTTNLYGIGSRSVSDTVIQVTRLEVICIESSSGEEGE